MAGFLNQESRPKRTVNQLIFADVKILPLHKVNSFVRTDNAYLKIAPARKISHFCREFKKEFFRKVFYLN